MELTRSKKNDIQTSPGNALMTFLDESGTLMLRDTYGNVQAFSDFVTARQQITVSATAPLNPVVNDLWVDTSAV